MVSTKEFIMKNVPKLSTSVDERFNLSPPPTVRALEIGL